MEIAVGSELGRQKRNRDACISEALASDVALLAVADGFGTIGRAPIAEAALLMVRDFLRRKMRSGAMTARNASPLTLRRLLLAAFAHANTRLFAQSGSHDDYVASGTSVTAALIVGSNAFIGHVGEARAYLVRDAEIKLLTEDDALCASDFGGSSMAVGAGMRSLLTRSLGTQSSLEATVTHVELRSSDRLMLCTDGVHKSLSNDELAFATAAPATAPEIVDRILALMKMRGNSGGGTVIAGRELTVPIDMGTEVASARRSVSAAIAVTALVLVLAIVVGWLYEAIFPTHFAIFH